jgi:DNA-binding HxlR family transcriptional regulator
MHCSIGRTLDVVGEWWTLLIVRDIHLGLRRFDDIADNLGISRNLLAGRLDRLVTEGILERRPYQDRPPRHEYHFTEAGWDLVPVLLAVMAWGDKWVTPPGGPAMTPVHDTCGAEFTPTVSCSHCGRPITAKTVTVKAGPGAAPGPGTQVLGRLAQTGSR